MLEQFIFIFTLLAITSCTPSNDSSRALHEHTDNTQNNSQQHNDLQRDSSNLSKGSLQTSFENIITLFDQLSFFEPPRLVDCTLSGGTKTHCVSITFKPQPASMKIGPWCPRNISDGPEKSGIWLENGNIYDADGAFITQLSEFYNDDKWQMFDEETGKIYVTDTKIACKAAAKPIVEEEYYNYCVECQVSYMDSDSSNTYIIPLQPNKASPSKASKHIGRLGVGIAFSGALIDASAPTNDILAAHTLAPFDDCGGHVNLHSGYHIHAITDKEKCLKDIKNDSGDTAAIGIAMDGYMIHRLDPNATDLDSCGGHETGSMGYHYHAAAPGKNAILACHTGETGCSLNNTSETCDASAPTKRPKPPR